MLKKKRQNWNKEKERNREIEIQGEEPYLWYTTRPQLCQNHPTSQALSTFFTAIKRRF